MWSDYEILAWDKTHVINMKFLWFLCWCLLSLRMVCVGENSKILSSSLLKICSLICHTQTHCQDISFINKQSCSPRLWCDNNRFWHSHIKAHPLPVNCGVCVCPAFQQSSQQPGDCPTDTPSQTTDTLISGHSLVSVENYHSITLGRRFSVQIIKCMTRTEQGHEDIWCELCNVTNLIPISPYCFMVAFDTKCLVNSYFWLTYLTRHPHSVSLSLILRGKNDVRNVRVPRCSVWSLAPRC